MTLLYGQDHQSMGSFRLDHLYRRAKRFHDAPEPLLSRGTSRLFGGIDDRRACLGFCARASFIACRRVKAVCSVNRHSAYRLSRHLAIENESHFSRSNQLTKTTAPSIARSFHLSSPPLYKASTLLPVRLRHGVCLDFGAGLCIESKSSSGDISCLFPRKTSYAFDIA